uniref:Alternative protein ZNF649 n=1 Tax=Homo sapiens TaxID=9606 RepID=L8E957_HUMAN|nr:alternative protein ZNF649 [Homo sapiens]
MEMELFSMIIMNKCLRKLNSLKVENPSAPSHNSLNISKHTT